MSQQHDHLLLSAGKAQEDPVTGFFYTCFWPPNKAFWLFCSNGLLMSAGAFMGQRLKSVRWGQDPR